MPFPDLDALLDAPLYDLAQPAKLERLLPALREVIRFHIEHCPPYEKLCAARGFDVDGDFAVADIPYLPTNFFKKRLLLSIPEDKLFREIRSSATTSGTSSRMGLDKETSRRQSKCFTKTIIERIGNHRRRFIIADIPETLDKTAVVSARSSSIKSLMFLSSGNEATVITDHGGELKVDLDHVDRLMGEIQEAGAPVIVFGFTFVLYMSLVRPLLEAGKRYALPEGSNVIHIGGWKKLEQNKVTPEQLVQDCATLFSIPEGNVVDLYGFTEQSGLIYPTCEHGNRHVPVWAELIVRDPVTLDPLPVGQEGLMQFVTPIQTSYPGHSVLTEDVGLITGIDTCPCGRKGAAFKLIGRAAGAEVRGCGDIMAEKFA